MKYGTNALVVLVVVSLVGCGGGGGGGSAKTSNPSPDQTLFNNKSIAPITKAAENSAVASLDTAWIALKGTSMASQAKALVTQMSKMPQFQQGGITMDGCAWGKFTDGSPVIFLTNDPAIAEAPSARPNQTAAVPQLSKLGKPMKLTKSIQAKPFDNELPASNIAYVFNSFEALRSSPAPAIAQELSAAGYSVTSASGSLSDWANVQNAGLLLNSSHGLEYDDNVYVVTSDLWSAALDAQYAPQIKEHSIVRAEGEVLDTSPAGSHPLDDYAFDAEYPSEIPASRSMFSTSSLLYSMACSGAAPVASLAAFLETHSGLGVYLGWTSSVYFADANENASFFFDRTLGLDKAAPIDPTNPPPSPWSSVYGLMSDTDHQDGTPTDMNTSFPEAGGVSDFKILDSPVTQTSLVTLIPSVSSADSDAASSTLTLDGYFGSDQGSVLLNGSYLTVKSWTEFTVTTELPTESGTLVVHAASTANGYLHSNTCSYGFAGAFKGTYTGTDSDGNAVSGTFTMQIDDSGAITGTASASGGPVSLSGTLNSGTGAVNFGTAANEHVQATYTGTFTRTKGTIHASGTWSSVTQPGDTTSGGTWTTS